jgi:hypothetical protein
VEIIWLHAKISIHKAIWILFVLVNENKKLWNEILYKIYKIKYIKYSLKNKIYSFQYIYRKIYRNIGKIIYVSILFSEF